VRAIGGEAGNDFVSFRDLILDLMVSRSGFPEQLDGLLDSLAAGRQSRERWRRVIEVVLGDKLVHRLLVALVDLFVKASHKGFVLNRHDGLLTCRQSWLGLSEQESGGFGEVAWHSVALSAEVSATS